MSSSKQVLNGSNATKLKKTPHCLLAGDTFHFVMLLLKYLNVLWIRRQSLQCMAFSPTMLLECDL